MKILAIIIISLFFTSCGTRVGNPMNGGGDNGVQQEVNGPEFDVNVPALSAVNLDQFFPNEILSTYLQNTQDTLIQADIRTVDEVLKDTDVILTSISVNGVLNSGKQIAQGTLQNLTTILTEEEGEFGIQLLVCKDHEILVELHWTKDQKKILLIRNWAATRASDVLVAEILLNANDGNTSLESYIGEIRKVSENQTLTQAEVMTITRQFDGATAVSKTKSAFEDIADSTNFTGIDYTVAYLHHPNQNEFVRYYKENGNCLTNFDEGNPDSNWCEGGNITDSSIVFNEEQIKEAASRLSTITPLPQSSLRVPTYQIDKGLCK